MVLFVSFMFSGSDFKRFHRFLAEFSSLYLIYGKVGKLRQTNGLNHSRKSLDSQTKTRPLASILRIPKAR